MTTTKLSFIQLNITRVVKCTEQAVLVQLTDQHDEMLMWIPRSNLSYRTDKALDKNITEVVKLDVADWWLKENRL